MIGILPLIIKKTRPIYNRAGQKCGNNGPGGAGNLPRGFAAGEMEPNGDKRRVVGRGATLERSESVVGQNIGPGGADDRTRGFAAGETEA
mgnify:CR=1 FL=1